MEKESSRNIHGNANEPCGLRWRGIPPPKKSSKPPPPPPELPPGAQDALEFALSCGALLQEEYDDAVLRLTGAAASGTGDGAMACDIPATRGEGARIGPS